MVELLLFKAQTVAERIRENGIPQLPPPARDHSSETLTPFTGNHSVKAEAEPCLPSEIMTYSIVSDLVVSASDIHLERKFGKSKK